MGFVKEFLELRQNAVWRQLARELGAKYVDPGFLKGPRVVAREEEWTITLDTYTCRSDVTYTRMTASFENKDRFRFSLYRKGPWSGLGRWLGMQDIVVGSPDFDRDFIIKGNDESKVRALFANPKIRELIQAQPNIVLRITRRRGYFRRLFPGAIYRLYFEAPELIQDAKRLKSLFELFIEILNRLQYIHKALEDGRDIEP